MLKKQTPKNKLASNRSHYGVLILSLLVCANAIYILASSLIDETAKHHHDIRISTINVDLPILIGVSFLYLSNILRRRKRTGWIVTVVAYAFYLGTGINQFLARINNKDVNLDVAIKTILLPLLILPLLFIYEKEFVVKSDISGFRRSIRFSISILIVALIYGVAGFMLLDNSDFHQEIRPVSALHYTVDQFNITTSKPLHPYTKRAKIFDDSLSVVSITAVVYAVVSLFQPLRSKFSDQHVDRERMQELLDKYHPSSEEFFKIWPHDKQFYFDSTGRSGIAFRVHRGVALCVSDPVGDPHTFASLLVDFQNFCFSNDWLPAQVHVADTHRQLYEDLGYTMQKLGQEAVVDIGKFNEELLGAKYFRQILNKFNKQGYSTELLKSPHHPAVVKRLTDISNDWLSKDGRDERGFALGYFTEEYIQICDLLVARDAAGTIQGFLNLVPATYDKNEATYDMLRSSTGSLGNINDFLLIRLMEILKQEGYKRLNLGLSPLVGMDELDPDQKTMIDSFMIFAYANGDRFFSFSGLYKFKDKYKPQWQDKYLAYQGGIRGFSRTTTALTLCMKAAVKLPHEGYFKNKKR